MPLSDFAFDKYVEPHFSKFRSASIPVSTHESTRWLQAFVLTVIVYSDQNSLTQRNKLFLTTYVASKLLSQSISWQEIPHFSSFGNLSDPCHAI